jgi:type I restriction enzyme S subunit
MNGNLKTAVLAARKKLARFRDGSNVAQLHAANDTWSRSETNEADNLRSGWTTITMGEVGRWFGGGTPSKANSRFWTGGNIPWVSPKDMKCELITDAQDHITEDAVAQSATNLVDAGSVLIVVRSGILQHTLPVAVAQRQVALNQDLKAVKPRESVRSDYLALALKAFERDILHTCTKTGTTVQSLELPVFLRFRIPIAPLPEQRRIVAEIEKQFSRLEAGVAALRRVQANLKRCRAAILKAACDGCLIPGDLKSWRKITLGEIIVSMKNGIYKPRHAYADDGIACLRMYNIGSGKILWKDIKRMRLSREEIKEYGLLPGDVLVNRVN